MLSVKEVLESRVIVRSIEVLSILLMLASASKRGVILFFARFRYLLSYVRAVFVQYKVFGLVYLPSILLEKESPEVAIRFLQKILSVFPNYTSARLRLADLYFRLGYRSESLKSYRMVFQTPILDSQIIHKLFVHQFCTLLMEAGERKYFDWLVDHVCSEILDVSLAETLTLIAAETGQWNHCETLIQHIGSLALRNNEVAGLRLRVVDVSEVYELESLGRARMLYEKCENIYRYMEPTVFEEDRRKARVVGKPAHFVAEFLNAQVVGAFNILHDGRLVVVEPAGHPRHGFVAGNWQYIVGAKGHEDKALLKYPYSKTEHLPSAVLLSGRCSANYFHWLIEYVPKLFDVDSNPELRELPLIVESKMPEQHWELLEHVWQGKRPIYKFDHDTLLNVDRLIVPSTPTYLLDDFEVPAWISGAISEVHLCYVRERVLAKLASRFGSEERKRFVYISRKRASARKLANESAVEALFASRGFEIVYPETLSFAEQVQLFYEADVIAGPGGAAFANALFCRKGASILCLTSERNKDFSIFANIAQAVGANFTYLTGPNCRPRSAFRCEADYVFSSFSVDLQKAERAIKAVLASDTVAVE